MHPWSAQWQPTILLGHLLAGQQLLPQWGTWIFRSVSSNRDSLNVCGGRQQNLGLCSRFLCFFIGIYVPCGDFQTLAGKRMIVSYPEDGLYRTRSRPQSRLIAVKYFPYLRELLHMLPSSNFVNNLSKKRDFRALLNILADFLWPFWHLKSWHTTQVAAKRYLNYHKRDSCNIFFRAIAGVKTPFELSGFNHEYFSTTTPGFRITEIVFKTLVSYRPTTFFPS